VRRIYLERLGHAVPVTAAPGGARRRSAPAAGACVGIDILWGFSFFADAITEPSVQNDEQRIRDLVHPPPSFLDERDGFVRNESCRDAPSRRLSARRAFVSPVVRL